MALMRWRSINWAADAVSSILNWVRPECEDEWEDRVKSLNARVHVKRIGAQYGKETCQLGSAGDQKGSRIEFIV
jgi:hypothetical protein